MSYFTQTAEQDRKTIQFEVHTPNTDTGNPEPDGVAQTDEGGSNGGPKPADDDDDDEEDIDLDEEFDLGGDIDLDDDNELGEPDADDIEPQKDEK